MNGDFALGHCYWTMEGNAGAEVGHGFARDGGRIYEGLYLEFGSTYTFTAEVSGEGTLFVKTTLEDGTVVSREFNVRDGGWERLELKFSVPGPCSDCEYIPRDYSFGIESQGEAKIRNVSLSRI